MMRVVEKLTCYRFTIGLHMYTHGGNAVKFSNHENHFLKSCGISGYYK